LLINPYYKFTRGSETTPEFGTGCILYCLLMQVVDSGRNGGVTLAEINAQRGTAAPASKLKKT
jgi:hypothetical protein